MDFSHHQLCNVTLITIIVLTAYDHVCWYKTYFYFRGWSVMKILVRGTKIWGERIPEFFEIFGPSMENWSAPQSVITQVLSNTMQWVKYSYSCAVKFCASTQLLFKECLQKSGGHTCMVQSFLKLMITQYIYRHTRLRNDYAEILYYIAACYKPLDICIQWMGYSI